MKKRNQMKAVRMEGKVIGYVGLNREGDWVATTAKRKRIGKSWLREYAVRRVIAHAYDIEGFLATKSAEAIARMDKKRLRV